MLGVEGHVEAVTYTGLEGRSVGNIEDMIENYLILGVVGTDRHDLGLHAAVRRDREGCYTGMELRHLAVRYRLAVLDRKGQVLESARLGSPCRGIIGDVTHELAADFGRGRKYDLLEHHGASGRVGDLEVEAGQNVAHGHMQLVAPGHSELLADERESVTGDVAHVVVPVLDLHFRDKDVRLLGSDVVRPVRIDQIPVVHVAGIGDTAAETVVSPVGHGTGEVLITAILDVDGRNLVVFRP